jgi:hypothetical protein
MAMLWPMQLRCPAANGKNAYAGCCSSIKRSGRNSDGSAHVSGLWCELYILHISERERGVHKYTKDELSCIATQPPHEQWKVVPAGKLMSYIHIYIDLMI